MNVLEASNVVKKYAEHLALDKANVTVPENQIFGLLGPNGAGKTTFIRIINRITAADEGKVLFKGRPLSNDDIPNIGYLPEERGLYKKMKVGEQAVYLARLKGLSRHEALKRLKFWFEKFEIQTWWDKKVEELSKGMQQKVQFIVTVLHEPELLIFDEPFSGFDPINANLLKQEILRLKENGATVIFSTHNMGSVEELCDHITLINRSKTVLSGRVEEIKQNYKSNLVRLDFAGEPEQFKAKLNGNYQIESIKPVLGGHSAMIKIGEQLDTNALLQKVLPDFHIKGFTEVLPTMDEIFIKVVEETNQAG